MFITIPQGNDAMYRIVFRRSDGTPIDITDVEVRCEVRDRWGKRVLVGTVTKVNPTQGTIVVTFDHRDTKNLSLTTYYFMDFLLIFPDGRVKNLPMERIIVRVRPTVTKP